MTREETEARIFAALRTIAPEADPARADRDADLRDALDIDSLDQLRFLSAVAKDLHVDIPERDYAKLVTINAVLRYVEEAKRRAP